MDTKTAIQTLEDFFTVETENECGEWFNAHLLYNGDPVYRCDQTKPQLNKLYKAMNHLVSAVRSTSWQHEALAKLGAVRDGYSKSEVLLLQDFIGKLDNPTP